VKAGWQTKSVGELLLPQTTVNPSFAPEQTFSYIDVSSVSTETFAIEGTQSLLGKDAPSRARKLVRTNDVIFATIRPTLKRVAIIPTELDGQVCSTGYVVLRPTQALNTSYLFYWLFIESFSEQMATLQRGASYPAVSDADVRRQPISFPERKEQERIVAILDEAFEGIATAKANAQNNLENARHFFESYLESRISKGGAGWLTKPLAELCEIKHGFAFKSDCFRPSGEYVLLTPGNFFERGGYRDRGEKQKYYDGEFPKDFLLSAGDLLVAMTEQAAGLLGSPIIVPDSGAFLHNQRLGLVTSRSGVPWLNEFFFHVFNTSAFRKAAHDSASGVKVRHTSPTKLGEIVVSFPQSVKEQKRLVSEMEEAASEAEQLEVVYRKKVAALEALKQSVLHQAFTGKL
jgi:type I restriction enzyme S subunit